MSKILKKNNVLRLPLLTIAVASIATIPFVARAQSLQEALMSTYCNNHQLEAQRALLEATGELLEQARSGWYPRIHSEVYAGAAEIENEFANSQSLSQWSFSLNVEQPIYNGGLTTAKTTLAWAKVGAAEAKLRSVEQEVLLAAAMAYFEVTAIEKILELRGKNVTVLSRRLAQVEARRREGEVTRTDVAQAKARVAGAKAQERLAHAMLESAKAMFRKITSEKPSDLVIQSRSVEPVLTELDVFASAIEANPSIVAQRYNVNAATAGIDVAQSAYRPKIDLVGGYGRQHDQFPVPGETEFTKVGVRFQMPLYQKGIPTSRSRAARASARAQQQRLLETQETVKQKIHHVWAQLNANQMRILAIQEGIEAATLAKIGVEREASVGERTVLDTLNAEQELLSVQVELIKAQRDALSSEYKLHVMMGALTANRLGISADDCLAKTKFVIGF